MRITGLVSTYEEGMLAEEAVASLLVCCASVLVFEGPIGDRPAEEVAPSNWGRFGKVPRVVVRKGAWGSDAEKRTAMLQAAQGLGAEWGLVLDGDEVLVWGEFFPSLIEHVEHLERKTGEEMIGFPLRIVELDGSCAMLGARVLRLDRIERYVISSYHLLLKAGVEISKPNAPLVLAGEPDGTDRIGAMQKRRPVAGEPHVLHRSLMRSPLRQVKRQHVAEGESFEELDVDGLRFEAPNDDAGVKIWLPAS